MNSKEKGDISSSVILTELSKSGFSVLIPWGDKDRYDLVAEKDGIFHRIQVKTAWIDNDRIRFHTSSITTKNGKRVRKTYDSKQIDFFMAYCPDNDSVYCLSPDIVKSTDCFLRIEAAKNGQKKKVKLAQDYLFNGNLEKPEI